MHSDKFCILILWTFKVVSDAVKFPSANFVFSICCTVCFFLLPFLVLVEHFYDFILYIFLTHKLYFCFIFFMVFLSLQYIFQSNLSESSNNSVSLNVQCRYFTTVLSIPSLYPLWHVIHFLYPYIKYFKNIF